MTRPLVLCYHSISDDWERPLAVREASFRRQVESLLRRRFRPVGAAEAVAGTGPLLHVTFDDAYKDIARALTVLERLGVPATIFAAARFADDGRSLDVPELRDEATAHPDRLATMDWDDLRAVAERGFEIGSHTVSHPHLPQLSDAELDRELGESRERCEAELGRPCRFLAYPYGEHDERVRAAARRAGYDAAFSLFEDRGRSDRYAVPRVDLYRRDSLVRATLKTSSARRALYAVARRRWRDAGAPVHYHGHGWLPAVLPAEARRFRVADAHLAAILADAGAELVAERADVEIVPAAGLSGDAPAAVVSLDAAAHDSGPPALRAAQRASRSGRIRLAAARAGRAARRHGYTDVRILTWGPGTPLRPAGARDGRTLAERLPRHALVVAHRSVRGPTVVDALRAQALADAGAAHGGGPPSIRGGGPLLVAGDGTLLRVAVGPPRRQLERQRAVLEALRSRGAPAPVSTRVALPLGHGRSGLAEWSLESRLPGRPPAELDADLLEQCVDFLVALHGVAGDETPVSLRAAAGYVARHRPAAIEEALVGLGERLEGALAKEPRGFGHGDFFLGNLLVERGSLSGVVDWDAGGPGRLPLLDLIHLRHTAGHRLPDEAWGASIVRHLLPWARAGGDGVVRGYCYGVGATATPAVLEALVLAYWLDRLAYQLRTLPHRRGQARWLARNVDLVVGALAAGAAGQPSRIAR